MRGLCFVHLWAQSCHCLWNRVSVFASSSNCSATNFSMAANAAPSFADILAADSAYDMPADDKGVRVALDSFGVVFIKRKGDASDAVRADLLAGLALLHTHHLNLEPLVKVLTIAQQQTLSTALGLDFQAHGTDATWPSMLGRRIVA